MILNLPSSFQRANRMPLRHGKGGYSSLSYMSRANVRPLADRTQNIRFSFAATRLNTGAAAKKYTKRRWLRQELSTSRRNFFCRPGRAVRVVNDPEGSVRSGSVRRVIREARETVNTYLRRCVDCCHRARKTQVATPTGTRRSEINWDVLNGVPITPTPRMASPRRSSTRNRVTP